MCADSLDKNDLCRVTQFDIQTVIVPLYIEDNAIIREKAGRRVTSLDVIGRFPFVCLHFANPRVYSGPRIGMSAFEFIQYLPTDDPHGRGAQK
jgi:hypothetical protein